MQTQTNLGENKPKLSVGFFFLCLGLLITLITSVVSILNLVFSVLDKQFPDVLNATYQYGYSTYDYESIRMALATLFIFFPVFIVISYFWKKFSKQGLGHLDEVIKKWVIYIILFLAAIVLVVDLVTLVKYFISGEITGRFIFKVLAVLVVALKVGLYYILELKGREKIFGFKVDLWAPIKASVLVLAVIIWSFTVIGTPGQQRTWRLDDKRVQDLQNIQYQVINYWQQKEKLPENLSVLSNPLSGSYVPVDPEFEKPARNADGIATAGGGKKYEYIVKDKMTFELCADFSAVMPKGWKENQNYYGGGVVPMMAREDAVSSYPYPGPNGGVNDSWDHQIGRTCFERTIDEDIYPPYPKMLKN